MRSSARSSASNSPKAVVVRELLIARAPAEMNIGIVCYASVGGSGVVAAELARCLADRGHRTHVISSDTPFRLRESDAGRPLSSRRDAWISAVSRAAVSARRWPTGSCRSARAHRLDIIHAHYAIPHAAAAYLARQILASAAGGAERCRARSRRCMAPTSRFSARIRRIVKRWRSASISPTP